MLGRLTLPEAKVSPEEVLFEKETSLPITTVFFHCHVSFREAQEKGSTGSFLSGKQV